MKLLSVLALVFSLTALGVTFSHHGNAPQTAAAAKESAFDRVMRTGVLRCGYDTLTPFLVRDPNTSELSGFNADIMKVVTEKTGLKVEWTEEINFGNWLPALQAGRFDAVCTPIWPDMALGRRALFTKPYTFAGVAPVVRADNISFDGHPELLNNASTTVAVWDNDATQYLAKEAFPKAKLLIMPVNTDAATAMENVTTGKADFILVDQNNVFTYNSNNTAKVKMIDPDHPVKAQPFAGFTVLETEPALRDFLDNAMADLQSTGTIDRLLTKWEAQPGMFLRTAEPYRTTLK